MSRLACMLARSVWRCRRQGLGYSELTCSHVREAPCSIRLIMNACLIRAFLFLIILASAQARPIALVGGRLIDGFGGHPLANSVIIIENERVTKIGTVGALDVPPDAEIISTEGMDVLPGLWDCHVHTMLLGHSDYEHWDKTYPPRMGSEIMPAAARQLLMAGVTSARDLGGPAQGQH